MSKGKVVLRNYCIFLGSYKGVWLKAGVMFSENLGAATRKCYSVCAGGGEGGVWVWV